MVTDIAGRIEGDEVAGNKMLTKNVLRLPTNALVATGGSVDAVVVKRAVVDIGRHLLLLHHETLIRLDLLISWKTTWIFYLIVYGGHEWTEQCE